MGSDAFLCIRALFIVYLKQTELIWELKSTVCRTFQASLDECAGLVQCLLKINKKDIEYIVFLCYTYPGDFIIFHCFQGG